MDGSPVDIAGEYRLDTGRRRHRTTWEDHPMPEDAPAYRMYGDLAAW